MPGSAGYLYEQRNYATFNSVNTEYIEKSKQRSGKKRNHVSAQYDVENKYCNKGIKMTNLRLVHLLLLSDKNYLHK